MKRFLIALAACLPMVPAHAAHHQKKVVTVVAVPVAVPVAPYSAVHYSNQVQPFTNPPVSARDQLIKELAREIAAELRGDAPVKQFAEKQTMFAVKCASCHGKANPDGRPLFAGLDALTEPQRLASIKAIVTEHMPKGGKLTPQEVGQLMLELSTIPEPKAAAEAPPVPMPPAGEEP